jgi:hypothetical protein
MPPTVHAYVGPGLGLGVIGAVIGGIIAILLAIVGVVWYPVKRVLRKKKRSEAIREKARQETEKAESIHAFPEQNADKKVDKL